MKKAEMALEFPFKIMLYVIVILVVIGLIIGFRNELTKPGGPLNFCNLFPSGCEQNQPCSTATENAGHIDQLAITKFCNFCWEKTGKVDSQKACLCYLITGDYSLESAIKLPDYCQLKCAGTSNFVTVKYDWLIKKVVIECVK